MNSLRAPYCFLLATGPGTPLCDPIGLRSAYFARHNRETVLDGERVLIYRFSCQSEVEHALGIIEIVSSTLDSRCAEEEVFVGLMHGSPQKEGIFLVSPYVLIQVAAIRQHHETR